MTNSLAAKQRRCNAEGRALAGSQRQIQYYVNEQPILLQQTISNSFGIPLILRWVSPLSSAKYREYRDSAFLNALGIGKHRKSLNLFWPSGGPRWDALAVIEGGGILLVEAKSHVPEIFGNGCGAEAEASVRKIDRAMVATGEWLNIAPRTNWKGTLYQSVNRIAHLYFLREVLGIEAWLVNVYFTDDPHSPTSRASWETGLATVKESLGTFQIPFCADVVLPAMEER